MSSYKKYMDIFSMQKAKILLEHWPYDLAIQIERNKIPPLGLIYSLSVLELETLQEFLEKNTKTDIICPSKFSCGALVLFVKKKDRTLHLCVDYHSLNRMTHKNQYPIPLLNDLLDAPRKAWIYSKIDLKSAYHLLRGMSGKQLSALTMVCLNGLWCYLACQMPYWPSSILWMISSLMSWTSS